MFSANNNILVGYTNTNQIVSHCTKTVPTSLNDCSQLCYQLSRYMNAKVRINKL